jgi:hypothetical protein
VIGSVGYGYFLVFVDVFGDVWSLGGVFCMFVLWFLLFFCCLFFWLFEVLFFCWCGVVGGFVLGVWLFEFFWCYF